MRSTLIDRVQEHKVNRKIKQMGEASLRNERLFFLLDREKKMTGKDVEIVLDVRKRC